MLGRQKALLRLVWEIRRQNKYPTKTFVDKLLFVLQKEYGLDDMGSFYHFYPHLYGPFSSLFYVDVADLESRGYLNEAFELNEDARKVALEIESPAEAAIVEAVGRFGSRNIVEYVYKKYPVYAARSRLTHGTKTAHDAGIFTIGYEKKDIDLFLDLLIQNNVDVLVDVRANPFSMNPSYTRSKLERSLKTAEIEYLHVPELGINGEYRKNLEDEKDYKQLFAFYRKELLPKNMEKLKVVADMGKKKRIVLMCFESEHSMCHRGVLAEKLTSMGFKVGHI